MATRLALLKTRFVCLVRGQGAIRLEDDDAENEKGLPWVLSGDEADNEGYTNVHLLAECIAASIWNALCMLYLLHPSSSLPAPPHTIIIARQGPDTRYLYALMILTLVPLAIGVAAGSAALWSDEPSEKDSRSAWGRVETAGVWAGTVGCIAGMWPLVRVAVKGWETQYQAEVAVILIVLQAFLVKSGSDSSFPTNSPGPLSFSAIDSGATALDEEKTLLLMKECEGDDDEETRRVVVRFCA